MRPINLFFFLTLLLAGSLFLAGRGWGNVEAPIAVKPLPLAFTLEAPEDTYSAHKPILLRASLKALQSVDICLHSGHLETDFKFELSRGGFGKVVIPPQSVQLSQKATVNKISLIAGQTQNIVFDLKKWVPLSPTEWVPGDYRIQAKFFLCGKTDGSETTIPAQAPLHILIME